MKNRIQLILVLSLIILISSCKQKSYFYLEGFTMGTLYHIKFESKSEQGMKEELESQLIAINNSLSTYISTSTISKVNQSQSVVEVDSLFRKVFLAAKEVYSKTHGAFDPTVMPLVNAWGFGFDTLSHVDSFVIDSLMAYIGFDKVRLVDNKLEKDLPEIMLDFSAIAKGFGVDVIAEFLEEKNIANYMVEIGGEVRVKGLNPKGEEWRVGIEKPAKSKSQDQDFDFYASLTDISLATSGNYRNYYMRNGKKIAHTINPETGYPIYNDILSATVLHKECMIADAYATAFMVLGYDKSIEIIEREEDVVAYLISRDNGNDYCSPELQQRIKPISD
jgi:thiamine biosynthesis lipoprotein